MKCLRNLPFLFIAASVLSLPTPGEAILSPMVLIISGDRGVWSRCYHPSIRMDLLQVTMRPRMDHCAVDAAFHLFNTGASTTVWVGFRRPFWWPRTTLTTDVQLWNRPSDFSRFRAWIDGLPREFSENPGFFTGSDTPRLWTRASESQFMVTQVRFRGYAITRIRVKYEAPYRPAGWLHWMYGECRYWKGNIATASFVIDSGDIGGAGNCTALLYTDPGPRVISGNLEKYQMSAFEPHPVAHLQLSVRSRYR